MNVIPHVVSLVLQTAQSLVEIHVNLNVQRAVSVHLSIHVVAVTNVVLFVKAPVEILVVPLVKMEAQSHQIKILDFLLI